MNFYNPNKYYFKFLSKDEKELYKSMLSGLKKRETNIVIGSNYSNDQISRVYDFVILDEPSIFYVKDVYLEKVNSALCLNAEYRFKEEECNIIQNEMRSKADIIVQQIKGLSDVEKIKQIHDFIISNVVYKDLDAPYSHQAPGTLVYGIGVCEGIAKSFKYICDLIGLESGIVIGSADIGANSNVEISSALHAWNIVKIGNQYSQIDLTFDYCMSTEKNLRYDYFLLSDYEITKTHNSILQIDPCDYNYNYYQKKGLFATKSSDLKALVRKHLDYGKTLTFQMPIFEQQTEEKHLTETILKIISEEVTKKHKTQYKIKINYNIKRMIFDVCMSYY